MNPNDGYINRLVSQPPYQSPKLVKINNLLYCWTDGEYCSMVEASPSQVMLFQLLMSKSLLRRGKIKMEVV
jgi:hypothetical protein